jgi:hypothetical protein
MAAPAWIPRSSGCKQGRIRSKYFIALIHSTLQLYHLQTLFSQRDGTYTTAQRMLAVMYFKTGVERHWRETAQQ